MVRVRQFLRSYRFAFGALAVSAALHAAVIVGFPRWEESAPEASGSGYTASLEAGDAPAVQPAPAPSARPRPAKRPMSRLAHVSPELLMPLPPMEPVAPQLPPLAEPAPLPELPPAESALDKLALAPATAPPSPPPFPVDALPPRLSVSYSLTSAFADGLATYEWSREGDRYEIRSEAQAVGFFAVFLEGRIRQESEGLVTPEGLRPSRFVEHRPNTNDEGLEFDWENRRVTFDKGGERRTEPITAASVDWLSMIFQLAHVPPSGETYELQVFTQRKHYKFQLRILGTETIEVPIGTVRALHVRHVDAEDPSEIVDVWIGLDQHNLPVKLRFPVARNRFMVEQVATSIKAR